MTASIVKWVDRKATWATAGLLVVVMLLLVQGFNWRSAKLGPENKVLDVLNWYTPEKAAQVLDALGPDGRSLYAITQLTLDLAFPLTYGFLFAILILRIVPADKVWLIFAPLFTMVFDLLENFTAVYLALSFDGSANPLAWFAAICTLLKSLLFLASLFIIVIFGFKSLRKPVN